MGLGFVCFLLVVLVALHTTTNLLVLHSLTHSLLTNAPSHDHCISVFFSCFCCHILLILPLFSVLCTSLYLLPAPSLHCIHAPTLLLLLRKV